MRYVSLQNSMHLFSGIQPAQLTDLEAIRRIFHGCGTRVVALLNHECLHKCDLDNGLRALGTAIILF